MMTAAQSRLSPQPGEMYRISYAVGLPAQRRVARSVAVYSGQSERRMWDGRVAPCLDFSRPQGRSLSLLLEQIVDMRPASLNARGQLILINDSRHHRAGRRRVRRVA
jgi:hypothetical protein